MKILNLNNKEEVKRVNDFLNSCPYHDCMQTINWLLFKPSDEKFGVYIEDENNNIILYSNIFIINKNGVKKLYTSRGPICDYSNYDLINKFIKEITDITNIDYLVMDPRIFEFDFDKCIGSPKIINHLDYFSQQYSSQNAIVTLTNMDDLLNSFHSKTRYNIRQSIKKNVYYKVVKRIDIDKFYELYLDTAYRHEFKPHNKEYFINLLEIYKDDLVLCEVRCDDVVVCIGIYLIDRDKLYYLYGVSVRQFQDRMPSYAQHFKTMEYAYNMGLKYYDFGGVFCTGDDVTNGDYGLYKFKLGFCREFVNYIGEIEFDLKSLRGQ